MQCPTCKEIELIMAERQGVEIDYCPRCRGVWLDRGELDKIIERAAATPAPDPRPPANSPPPAYSQGPSPYASQSNHPQHPAHSPDYRRRKFDDDDDDYKYDAQGNRVRRRKSWLSDILDFD